jgi:hypothetical protein
MSGARNLHRLAGAVVKMQREALAGPCCLPSCDEPSVGFIQTWDLRSNGVCERHRREGERRGYTVHTEVNQ